MTDNNKKRCDECGYDHSQEPEKAAQEHYEIRLASERRKRFMQSVKS
jgi:hypothetical protein